MQLQQFSQCYPLESTEAPRVLILKELLCLLRRKALNHTQSILRATLYVNHKSRSLHPSDGAACRGLRSTGCGFCPFPPVPLPVFNFFLDENLRPAYMLERTSTSNPLCFPHLKHSLAQRADPKRFEISSLRTLFIATGVCTPVRSPSK
jgi:hypothetical protein